MICFQIRVKISELLLEEKSREMKKQLEKRREKKRKKFTGCPDYGYYTPKTDSHKEKYLKSRSPKQVTVPSHTEMLQFIRKRKIMRRSLN